MGGAPRQRCIFGRGLPRRNGDVRGRARRRGVRCHIERRDDGGDMANRAERPVPAVWGFAVFDVCGCTRLLKR